MAPHPTGRSISAVLSALAIAGLVLCVGSGALAQAGDGVEITPGIGEPPATPGTSAPEIPAAELAPPEPMPADGGSHRITQVTIEYASQNADHPSAEQVLLARVPLLETPEGFVAPREGYPSTMVTLAGIPEMADQMFFDSALARVAPAVVIRLQQLGLIGVYAEPDRAQFVVVNGRVQDLRAPDDTTLRLIITTGHVTEVNTTALGDRVPEDLAFNNPVHERIRENSPIQPGDDASKGTVSLLRRDKIDRYTNFLSRHPGRRVDVAVAATGDEPGAVALDYLVTENRPWLIYGQVANTGTESTNSLRERFGFINNQLTNSDDTFSVEYLTSNFTDALHTVVASYERPFFSPRLRSRVYGSWYMYQASDVGQPNADFDGDGWSVGAELIWNFLQIEDRFFDFVGGVRNDRLHVNNELADISGHDNLFVGYTGLRYERTGIAASSRASVTFEFSLDGLKSDSVNELGRFDASRNWQTVNLAAEQSFFLEPLLNPDLDEDSSLVHEFVLTGQGQLAFNHRLIPNYEQVAGGLFTVRGYDEAIVAGDTTFIGSFEYRFHLPRSFAPEPQPAKFFGAPFRFAPQYKYGPVDWDFILKAFLDVGVTLNSDRQVYERNNVLVGTGVGAELSLSRHLSARMDLGWALQDAKTTNGRVVNDVGDFRLHFLVTVVF